ncbi:MAG: response regulator transcription factor [Prolixibacteraceae bacterium]|nr:response regulator transcription factor [Prolixibacteraceae bacterium]
MKIHALIIDDEPLAQDVIKQYAQKLPDLTIISACDDAICAKKFINENKIDLIFLDINMPKLSGITFLKNLDNPPLVIFTTAYSEYALEGFELNAVDYLKKPFSFERFAKAYFRAEELISLKRGNEATTEHKSKADFLFIKADKKTIKVKFSDIVYIEGLGDYIKIHLTDKKIVTNLTMKKIAELLPDTQFYRIHKSYIISLENIELVEGNMVKMVTGKLPIGNSYRQDFIQFIKTYLAE